MSKITLVNIFELVTKGSNPKSKALTSVSGKIQFFLPVFVFPAYKEPFTSNTCGHWMCAGFPQATRPCPAT